MTMTTLNYIPGPAVGHDWRHEEADAREAARDAAIDQRMEDLKTGNFRDAREVFAEAMMRIAENEQKQEMLERCLFRAWQNQGDWLPQKTMREFALGQVLKIINDAMNLAVEAEFKQRH